MAPKRRKKAGLTRMDAAIDQMSDFGFSKQLIRKTVTNLLKLYGDDGWKLIEEDAYKVVLDVILDEQETAQTHNLLENAPSTKVAAEDASVTSNAESSQAPSFPIERVRDQECLKVCSFDACENTPLLGCSSDVIHAPVKASARRRKPCYGWISDDDADDDLDTKVITLTPAAT